MAETDKSTQTKGAKSTHRLAVLGLIFLIIPPVGFVLSIIAGRRAALHGKPSLLATLGTITNAILLLIVTIFIVSLFRNGHYIDPRANDPVVSDQITFATMKEVNSEIHRYIKEKRQLPLKIDDLKTLDGFESRLADARGTSLVLVWSPQGCDGIATCKSYSLRAIGRKLNKPMEIIYDAVEKRTYTRYTPEESAQQED